MDIGAASAVGLCVFSAYYPTVLPGIPGGDSGELVAEACNLGVAHPPGYPLFVYAARAAIEVLGFAQGKSAGTPAYRVNVASAALGSITAALLCSSGCRILHALRRSVVALGTSVPMDASLLERSAIAVIAASAASAWALSPLIWTYAVGAEVFSLNNFCCAVLLLAWLRYADKASKAWALRLAAQQDKADVATGSVASAEDDVRRLVRRACFLAFLCGLSLCNQHTSLLLIVPIAGLVAASLAPALTPGRLASVVLSGLLGLTPYLHMPIAHRYWRSPGSWGDASTLSGFLRHFLRSDYGTFRLLAADNKSGGGTEGFQERTGAYMRDLAREQLPHPAWLLVAVVGLLACAAVGLSVCFKSSGSIVTPWSKKKSSSGINIPKIKGHESSSAGRAADAAAQGQLSHAAAVCSMSAASPALFLAFYLAVFHSLSNMPLKDPLLAAIHARFWLQPNELMFIGLAAGLYLPVLLLAVLAGRGKAGNSSTSNSGGGVQTSSVSAVLAAAAAYLAYSQLGRNAGRMDASHNDVFDRYGRALLMPLPAKAILVTAYDFQWTATRYLQACEGIRSDVSLFNAPMLSYGWFSAQRYLYPRVAWPGTHLTTHMTAPHAAGGFSFADFIAANMADHCGLQYMSSYLYEQPHDEFLGRRINGTATAIGAAVDGQQQAEPVYYYKDGLLANFPKEYPLLPANRGLAAGSLSRAACSGRHGGLFFAGPMSYRNDEVHSAQVELRPYGAVGQVAWKTEDASSRVNTWRNMTRSTSSSAMGVFVPEVTGKRVPIPTDDIGATEAAWRASVAHFDGITAVPLDKHDPSTWERASRIEFWGSAVSYGTWLLEWALDTAVQGEIRAAWVAAGAAQPLPDGIEPINVTATLMAASLLEEGAYQQAAMSVDVTPVTWKNIGLAYVRLVRWPFKLAQNIPEAPVIPGMPPYPPMPKKRPAALKAGSGPDQAVPAPRGAFTSSVALGYPDVQEEEWRSLAAERVLETWSMYLAAPEAAKDPSRPTIAAVVDTLRKAASKDAASTSQKKKTGAQGQATGGAQGHSGTDSPQSTGAGAKKSSRSSSASRKQSGRGAGAASHGDDGIDELDGWND